MTLKIGQNLTVQTSPAVMAEVYALDKHCRVCGGRLKKAKGGVHQVTHICSDNKEVLLVTFGLDVSLDTPDIHPLRFCNSCYAACLRQATAALKGAPFHHSIDVFSWTQHE